MKKQLLSYLLALITAIMVLLLLISCKHQHIYGEWETISQPTCTETGSKTRVCECGEIETETLLAKDHISGDWIIDTDATCVEDGIKHQVCSVCNASVKNDIIAAKGHTGGKWIVSSLPDCKKEGSEYMNCSVCGQKIKERKMDTVAHSYSSGTCQWCGLEQPVSTGLDFSTNEDGTCYVSGIGTCADTDILIPSVSPEGDIVTGIGHQAFYYNKNITSVVLPDTVTFIDHYAFSSCSNLEKIEFSDSLTSIGGSAFSYCSSLTELTIPSSVTLIREDSFSCCSSLSNITVNESNTEYKSVEGNLYSKDCKTLIQFAIGKVDEDFAIPQGVVTIKEYAFSYSVNLRNIIIPSSVTSIEERAFSSYNLLTNIEVDDDNTTYKSLEGNLYSKDESILIQYAIGKETPRFTIPNGVVSIANYAFAGARNLAIVVIPNGVTTLGENAFYDCKRLVSICLGCDVTTIGDWAFANCPKLFEVVNNSSLLIEAGSENFEFIARYAKEVHAGESKITALNDYLFYTYDNTNYLLAYIGEETSLILPDSYNNGTYEITDSAFYDNDNIISVTIPDSVTAIGTSAFQHCSFLENVKIGDRVSQIFAYTFMDCEKLEYVDIGNGVTIIGQYAFEGCYRIKTLTLPENVEHIESDAFWGCTGITSIIICDNIKSIGSGAFNYCLKLTDVYYTGTKEQWQNIIIDMNNNYLTNATIHFGYEHN